MSPSIPPATQNEWPQKGLWPYLVPPIAASIAILPAFKDLVAKSAEQKGLVVPHMSFREILVGGLRMAPTTGLIVSSQIFLQSVIEKALIKDKDKASLPLTIASSAIVGVFSTPILAIFNGQTMGWSFQKSLQRSSPMVLLAIAVQETAFVSSLSATENLIPLVKDKVGNTKVFKYTTAFITGALSSLVSHPANTAVTRWQNDLEVTSLRQSMWGAMRKARAIGVFAVVYKLGKETLYSTTESSK